MPFSTLPSHADGLISPFAIEMPQEALDGLKTLLRYSKIAVPTFENSQKDGRLGLDRDWMLNIKEKWINFDWRETESRLNSFPHFMAHLVDDDGSEYDIHFAALFSEKADAVPLIMLHGWPGCFLEFMPIFKLLKEKYTPETLPYHVIVPSLPGYTLSSGPRLEKDFGIQDASRILNRLMGMLGFEDGYVAQGGDIGSEVARDMATTYPTCKAVHVNFLVVLRPPPNTSEDDLTTTEKRGLARTMDFFKFGIGYALEHATKPSTIGLVLASSPLALMAWIGEKFPLWSDITPSDETIIEFVTLYWITSTIERCIYPYRHDFPEGAETLASVFADPPPPPTSGSVTSPNPQPPHYVKKPMGFSSFPKEIAIAPESWAATQGDLVFYRRHEKGGHFAALEEPKLLLQDVEDFIEQVWEKK